MKTVIITGEKSVAIQEVPTPRAFGDFTLVKILSAPMCTEYKKYFNGTYTINPGHEAAGIVAETAASGNLKAGDRVIVMPQYPCGKCSLCTSGEYIHCENLVDPRQTTGDEFGTGTYAEYILKPHWLLLQIPDDISIDEAAMACCGFGPAFAAGKTMNINAEDTVLITGLGPVGLGAVISSKFRGAKVIGCTRNEFRRKLALELGADAVIDPSQINLATEGNGVNKVIECSGDSFYQQLALKTVKRKGEIAFIGESSELSINISKDLLRKGLTLHGIWHWNLNDTPEMINLIGSSKEKISKFITHKFPLAEIEEAFKIQQSGQCGKIILRP